MKMLKITSLCFFVLAIGFFGGVHFELNDKISRYLFFYQAHYEKANNIDLAESFVTVARRAITSWKSSYIVLRYDERERAHIKREFQSALRFYELLKVKDLPKAWYIHTTYFYAYTYFVCADTYIEDDTEKAFKCLEQSQALLNGLFKVDMDDLDEDSRNWLRNINIDGSLAILETFIYALKYQLVELSNSNGVVKENNKDLVKNAAITALRKLGMADYLINQNVHKDRLLGCIFKLAYPDVKIPEGDEINCPE